MPDKRSYLRFNASGIVDIKTESDTPKIFQGELINIGFRGFSVSLKEKIDIDTVVQFELRAETWSRPLIGKGKIKNIAEGKRYGVGGFRVGIEFIEADTDNVKLLLNKIRRKIIKEKEEKKRDLDIQIL